MKARLVNTKGLLFTHSEVSLNKIYDVEDAISEKHFSLVDNDGLRIIMLKSRFEFDSENQSVDLNLTMDELETVNYALQELDRDVLLSIKEVETTFGRNIHNRAVAVRTKIGLLKN